MPDTTPTTHTPNPLGRPTKYRPEYCQQVKDFMATGKSLTAYAGYIDVSRETVYEWERSIPAFSDAVKTARAKRVNALEDDLLQMEGSKITARIFALKNACPDEWREKQQVEHTDPSGGNPFAGITVNFVRPDATG